MKRYISAMLCAVMLLTCTRGVTLADETQDTIVYDSDACGAECTVGGYRVLDLEKEVATVEKDAPQGALRIVPYQSVSLPETYRNCDLPAIRGQSPYGTCWAFSAVALGEADLIQNSGATTDIDLSELQTVYFTYHSVADPLGGTDGDVYGSGEGFDILDGGGNLVLASQVLANWVGYADEETLPYSCAAESVNSGLADSLAYADVAHVQGVYNINISTNPELVKQFIMENGAVAISYCAGENDCYNSACNSYYVPESVNANHAVVLVGWDDTFPKENFNTVASQDGAWLVRNSWGSNQDCRYGYFWLSYDDQSITEQAYAFDVAGQGDSDYYTNNYQYDGTFYSDYEVSYNTLTAANVFTACAESTVAEEIYGETLKAVSFATYSANLEYEIQVYVELADRNNPESGTLASVTTGSTACSGLHTVPLATRVKLREGDTYAIVVKLSSGNSSGWVTLLNEATVAASQTDGWFYCTASAKPGQSFLKSGDAWADYGEQYQSNFRIKAYTDNITDPNYEPFTLSISESSVELGKGEQQNLEVVFNPESAAQGKTVVWESENTSVATVDANGVVTAVGLGKAYITATVGGETALCEVSVVPRAPTVTAVTQDDGSVLVEWNSEESGVTYTIKRFTYSTSLMETLATVSDSERSYIDSSALPGERYLYKVITVYKGEKGYEASAASEVAFNQFQITYVLNGGTASSYARNSFGWNEGNISLAIPSKEGANFEGWYYDSEFQQALSFSSEDGYYLDAYNTLKNVTVYAKWSEPVPDGGVSISKVTVAPIPAQDYTGTAITPEVTLTYEGATLVRNEDYTLKYRNNVNAGTASVVISGMGSYQDSVTVEFAISEKTLTESMVGAVENLPYTGEPIVPEPVVSHGDKAMVKDVDYVLSYENNTDVGTGTVIIIGIGNYQGEIRRTFSILGFDIGDAQVTAGKNLTVIYNPAGQKPKIKLEYEGKKLVQGTDYRLMYYRTENGERSSDAMGYIEDSGVYEIAVEGMGIYSGELPEASLVTVKPRTIREQGLNIISPYAKVEGQKAEVSHELYDGDILLVQGTDYEVQLVEQQEDKVIVSFTGKNNYSGTIRRELAAVGADVTLLDDTTVRIASIASRVYTGGAIRPEVTVERLADGKPLVEGTDYEVGYQNNINPGTATVVVSGKGNYVGNLSAEFVIEKVDIGTITEASGCEVSQNGVEVHIAQRENAYSGRKWSPQACVSFRGQTLSAGKDYTVNSVNSVDVGIYQLEIQLCGNFQGTVNFSYEIQPRDLADLLFVIPTQTYTGSAVLPEVADMAITWNGTTISLEQRNGITVSDCSNNTSLTGNGYAVATLTGTGNYTGTVNVHFQIARKSLNDEDVVIKIAGKSVFGMSTAYEAVWDGTAVTPEIELWVSDHKLAEGVDYSLDYYDNECVGNAKAVIHGLQGFCGNRTIFFRIIAIDIGQCEDLAICLSQSQYVYSGEANCPEVVVEYKGEILQKNADYTVGYRNNINAGIATVTIKGRGDYGGSISRDYTIQRKTKADAVSVTAAIADQKYTGEAILPAATLTIDGRALEQGVDYTIAITSGYDNVNTGKTAGSITFTGLGNYEGELATARFKIYATITYALNGGVNNPNNPTKYTQEDKVELQNPVRSGYQFAGWYTDSACTQRVYEIQEGTNGHQKFYAKWLRLGEGIDVSKWQASINWSSVPKEFVMIRITHGNTKDTCFEQNYSGARAYGLKTGVYCFNEATTVQGAIDEANTVLAILNGRPLNYPIALDMESYGDVGSISNETRTQMVMAFKAKVEAAGYKFILYANKNWMDNYFVNERLSGTDLWIARYCNYSLGHRYTGAGNVRIWQYSSTGRVSGINGNVDLDVCYSPY